MPTFKNISDSAFIDGNITVMPGQLWTVLDEARVNQLSDQYAWQFECVDGKTSEPAPVEGANEEPVAKPQAEPKNQSKKKK